MNTLEKLKAVNQAKPTTLEKLKALKQIEKNVAQAKAKPKETIKNNTQKAKEVQQPVNPLPPKDNGSIMSADTFYKNLSPIGKLEHNVKNTLNSAKNTALNFAYGMAKNVSKPLNPLLDALTVTREERAIANKETPEQIETAKRLDLLGEQNAERQFKKIPNQSWTREDMTGFEKGTELAGNVAGEVFKNIYGYAAAAPLSGAIPVVNKIANPFVRAVVTDQIADNIVQTPSKIVSGIANKEKPLDVAKNIGIQNAQDAALNLLVGGASEGIKKIKQASDESKALKNIDAKMKQYTDQKGLFPSDGVKTERLKPEPIKTIQPIKPIETKPQTLPMTQRTLNNVGDKKINAYQFDNPEVQNEIQAYAHYIKNNELLSGINKIESTSPVMKKLKEATKASYAEIDKALNNIIKDQGAENNAVSKRVEMVIDDMLTNGFDDIKGERWPADTSYLSKKSNIEGKPIKPISPDSNYLKADEMPLPKNNMATPKKIETLKKPINKTIDEPIETTITKLERSKGMLEFNNKMMAGTDNKLKTQGLINEINTKIDNLKAKQKLIPEDIDGLKTFIKGMEEQQSKGIEIDLQLFASAKEKLKKLERGFSKNIRTDNYIDDSLRKSFEENPLTYDPLSNKETLSKAEAIYNKGYDVALDEWNRNLGNFRPEDVPLSKMLANKAIENGDMDTARRIISDAANKLTQAGQYSQAARILRQADPGATNIFIQSELDKLNKDGLKQYGKKWKDIQLTDDELKAIDSMQGKPEADREAIMEEIFNNISRRLPVTNMEKFDAWRRMAMLLNPKTHVRNTVGNMLMKGLRVSSDKIGAVLEKAVKVPEGQRTKALRWKNNKELVDIVNSNWDINKKELLQEGRFDINSLRFLNRDKPIFKTKWLEAVNEFSKKTLNLEDSIFFKDAYKDSLGQYLKANNLKQVTKQAQEYATDKAMEATFKRTNQLATWINQAKSKKGIGKVVDAAVPFVKTPANILQTSVDYSPVGFLKLLYDRKSPAQVIETISKGLTGTALVGVGFGLASMGWMRLNRKNSAKAEEILGQAGEQPNSIVTPLGSYTFDWAQPFSVPLAMGAAIFESIEQDEDIASTVANAVAAGGDTLFNMSMLQNIKGLMGGKYDSTTEALMELPVSYLEQGFPTLFGQVARSIDPVRRNTYDSNPVKSFGKKVMAKTPGVSKLLPPKLDPFGQEQKQASALEQFFSPGYSKGKTDNPAIKEVARLYKDTKDTDFLPRIAPLKFSEKKIKYNLNSDQITKFQREMGQNNLSDIERLISSPSYQNASDEDKKKMIKKITDNNYERTKRNYLKENTGK